MEEYVTGVIASYGHDPADSDYQVGYLHAFIDMYEYLELESIKPEIIERMKEYGQVV